MTAAQAISLYTRYIDELWNAPDERLAPIASELARPGLIVHQDRTDDQDPGFTGAAALVEIVRSGRRPFDDVEVRLDVPPLAGGDFVTGRWTFSGTYKGGIHGATAPAGTPFSLGGLDLFRVEDGRLAEYWVTSDTSVLIGALGLKIEG